jgi:dipeptidyl aminopeptidase/acylaminoacyl peptidase
MRIGAAARNLTAVSIDRLVTSYEWRSERDLVALIDDGFRSKLYTVDVDGHASVRVTPDMKVSGFGIFNPASAILVAERMSKPPELWQWDGRPALNCVSDFNAHFDAFELQQPEMIRYKSFDGTQIEAALLRPVGVPPGTQARAVILVHGGPTAAWSDSFDRVSRWGQLLAQAGYAVLLPNIRGSTGYGHEFIESNRGDWGGRDFKDVLAGADYLTSHGLADPERLGIAGWSYGGYMAEWAITQTQRFKAAVAGAGMGDLAVEFGTEDHPAYDEWFYGLPYEKPEGFRKSSPLTYVRNARAPILILQGETDTVDPIGQSQMLYRALKRYGVVSDLVIYPREGHRIREAEHQKDVLTRVVKWFDDYLK